MRLASILRDDIITRFGNEDVDHDVRLASALASFAFPETEDFMIAQMHGMRPKDLCETYLFIVDIVPI
jgi:hypothetical protein